MMYFTKSSRHSFKNRAAFHFGYTAALLASALPSQAFAQAIGPLIQEPKDVPGNRIFPEYQPTGIKLSDFEIYPSVNVASRFDGNVFSRTSTKESDVIMLVEPQLSIKQINQSGALNINLMSRHSAYLDLPDQDAREHSVEATYVHGLNAPNSITVNMGHRREAIQRGTVENDLIRGEPLIRHVMQGSLTARKQFNRLSLDAQSYVAHQTFNDVRGYDKTLLPQSFRNLMQISLRGVATYEVSSRTALITSLEYDYLDYARSPSFANRDAENWNAAIGLKYEINRILFARLSLGLRHYDFKNSAYGSHTGLAVSSHIRYFPTRTLAVRGLIEQSNTTSPYDMVGAVTLTTARIEAEYEMRRSLSWFAASKLAFEDYTKKPYSARRFEISSGPQWRFNRNLAARGSLGYAKRFVQGPAPFEQYSQVFGMISLTLAR